MSPLILLVLEPEFGFGEADFATGLEVWKIISVRNCKMSHEDIAYRTDWGNVDMLYALLCLYLSIDPSRCSCCRVCQYSFHERKRSLYLPAAAAGSRGVLLPSDPGLNGVLWPKGLRLRLTSADLLEGDLDRRSNRELRLGSGSVWSKRERFALLFSSSAITIG